MKRRTVILGAAGLAGGGFYLGGGDVSNVLDTVDGAVSGENSTPMEQEFGGDELQKITFHEDGTADIWFEQFHDAHGFFIRYHEDNTAEDAIFACSAPESGEEGPVTIPLVTAIQKNSIDYPDRKFAIVAARGGFGTCDYGFRGSAFVNEKLSTATFRVPDEFDMDETPTPEPTETEQYDERVG
jgi:hypothetical protein